MKYDYFYEEQSEQFVFYKVPKVLCTEAEFRKLSSDAKLLYGLLLDRVSLSKKNGWIDGNGHVYVVFTLENIMQAFNCCDKTATKMMVELEKHGLIERKRQGQGKPVIIYVKNFIRPNDIRIKTRTNYDVIILSLIILILVRLILSYRKIAIWMRENPTDNILLLNWIIRHYSSNILISAGSWKRFWIFWWILFAQRIRPFVLPGI